MIPHFSCNDPLPTGHNTAVLHVSLVNTHVPSGPCEGSMVQAPLDQSHRDYDGRFLFLVATNLVCLRIALNRPPLESSCSQSVEVLLFWVSNFSSVNVERGEQIFWCDTGVNVDNIPDGPQCCGS
eukprot:280554-Amphidinium_carterae.1